MISPPLHNLLSYSNIILLNIDTHTRNVVAVSHIKHQLSLSAPKIYKDRIRIYVNLF